MVDQNTKKKEVKTFPTSECCLKADLNITTLQIHVTGENNVFNGLSFVKGKKITSTRGRMDGCCFILSFLALLQMENEKHIDTLMAMKVE